MDDKSIIIIRYGELYLKGDNREFFESALIGNIRRSLKGLRLSLTRNRGRYIISDFDDGEAIVERLSRVFGIHSISIARPCPSDIDEITRLAVETASGLTGTFKINARRADKRFKYSSPQICCDVGGAVLDSNPALTVDVHEPQHVINIDIRETGESYVYTGTTMGAGGLPVGTAGSGLLLLSGGLDSPVAGYMMAGRGLRINAVHYHSFPYTGEAAKQKVIDLAQSLTDYCGDINLSVVSFTQIQEELRKKTAEEYTVILMRRLMMRIAERIARQSGDGALITGESLGQVASQTLQSIAATDSVVGMPVFRPLIGSDKNAIIATARRIKTYDISVLPYEDCCTVFVPKHPVTKPRIDAVEREESKLDIDSLIQSAMSNIEVIRIKRKSR